MYCGHWPSYLRVAEPGAEEQHGYMQQRIHTADTRSAQDPERRECIRSVGAPMRNNTRWDTPLKSAGHLLDSAGQLALQNNLLPHLSAGVPDG